MDTYSNNDQIFLAGRHGHQEVYRFASPGLLHIKLVSSHCRMLHNERHTSILFGSFLRSPATILRHQQAFRMVTYYCGRQLGNDGEAKTVMENGGEI
jgi:hypothetical protein